MNSGKLLLGVLAGAAAGALAGVLLAPHKGTVTRKKISRNSGYLVDQVKGKFNELLDNITEEFTKVKEDVREFADEKLGKDHEQSKVTKTV
jgi:gas vesicle protein